MNWLIPANSNKYDYANSFAQHGAIDWRQGIAKYNVDDIVFIYCSKPVQKIQYKCVVTKINIPFEDTRDDKEYWINKSEYTRSFSRKFIHLKLLSQVDTPLLSLEKLKENGLKAAPQGPIKLNGTLANYINNQFNDYYPDNIFPEEVIATDSFNEGAVHKIIVNKYERSSIARAKCIEYHGCRCTVCGLDFKEKYGDIGEGFIHVHHLIPMHLIGGNYKINYTEDLVPVCPNCHAMLHRKMDGVTLSIECLKELLR